MTGIAPTRETITWPAQKDMLPQGSRYPAKPSMMSTANMAMPMIQRSSLGLRYEPYIMPRNMCR